MIVLSCRAHNPLENAGQGYGGALVKSSHKSETDVVLWSNPKNGVYKLLGLIDSFEWRGSLRYTFLLRGKLW